MTNKERRGERFLRLLFLGGWCNYPRCMGNLYTHFRIECVLLLTYPFDVKFILCPFAFEEKSEKIKIVFFCYRSIGSYIDKT